MHRFVFSLIRRTSLASMCSMLLLGACLGILPGSTQAATQSLTVSSQGKGKVTPNPDLPAYPRGSTVMLTAVAEAGWKFVGWSGDAQGSVNPWNVLMDQDRVVVARFEEILAYTVNFTVEGEGTVDLPNGSYREGTKLLVKATPAAGWVFNQWSGDLQGALNPRSFTVVSNMTIRARFVQRPVMISQSEDVNAEPGSSVSIRVVAEGSGTLSYQWFFVGLPLLNATSSDLFLPSVASKDEGVYQCRVTSPYGLVLSREIRLRVLDGCGGANSLTVCDEPSLRAAMERGGLIRFCCNGTIQLKSPLEATKDVVLDASERAVTLSGNGKLRILNVNPGIRVTVTNITFSAGYHVGADGVNGEAFAGVPGKPPVAGGDGMGGAIYNEGGDVLLERCRFEGNSVVGGKGPADPALPARPTAKPGRGLGGAVCSVGGSVTFRMCSLTQNQCRDGEPSTDLGNNYFISGAEAKGGAVYSTGGAIVRLYQTEVKVNQSTAHAVAGAGVWAGGLGIEDGLMELEGCIVEGNQAIPDPMISFERQGTKPVHGHGGAIHVGVQGRLVLKQTTLRSNKAVGSRAARHSGTGRASGGAIHSEGDVWIENCDIKSNSAEAGDYSSFNESGYGGAVFTQGRCVIVGSTIHDNLVEGGNAGAFGTIVPTYPPGHGYGGGIFNSGELSITNSTLCFNMAKGGERVNPTIPSGNAMGGGLFSSNGVVRLMNATLASNQVVSVDPYIFTPIPGLLRGANLCQAGGEVGVRNSVFAAGAGSTNAYGTILDLGYNMSSDASCAFASGTSFNLTDPRLLPLADNGGPTLTMSLSDESPAIDFGTLDGALSVDQRGFVRPVGARGDMGALEYDPVKASVRISYAREANTLILKFQGYAGSQYGLSQSVDGVNWAEIELIQMGAQSEEITRRIDLRDGPRRFYRVTTK